ncbi:MAG: hypothetical protein JNG84_01305 [Archangium sp.]|nr:hypothetical protein [Archangium sp.]
MRPLTLSLAVMLAACTSSPSAPPRPAAEVKRRVSIGTTSVGCDAMEALARVEPALPFAPDMRLRLTPVAAWECFIGGPCLREKRTELPTGWSDGGLSLVADADGAFTGLLPALKATAIEVRVSSTAAQGDVDLDTVVLDPSCL